MSLVVNPRSAITAIPDLLSKELNNPETQVSSTSDIEPTYNGDIKNTHPLGVHPCQWKVPKGRKESNLQMRTAMPFKH